MRATQCSSLGPTLTSTAPDRQAFLSLPEVLVIPLPEGALQVEPFYIELRKYTYHSFILCSRFRHHFNQGPVRNARPISAA